MFHITIVNINLVGTNKQEMGLSIKWTYFLIGLDKIVMIEFKSIPPSALNWNYVVWTLQVSTYSIQVKVGSGNNNVVNSSDLQPTPLRCLETNKLFSWWWDDDCGLVTIITIVPRGLSVMMSPAWAHITASITSRKWQSHHPSSANNCWHETPSRCVTSSHPVPVLQNTGLTKQLGSQGLTSQWLGPSMTRVTFSALLTTCHPWPCGSRHYPAPPV